ncbi:hypothetical protein [Paludibaculum fermentans]|uniref:hypothetical protein n=1 Tax=Paludibaculum fermentans TaxID=1473598 RepID=UPI003EBED632
MIRKQGTAESLNEIYTVALLLTGSRRRAEASVTEGLRQITDSDVRCESLRETLLQRTVSAALEGPQHCEADLGLPPEMQRVLALPVRSRHCFVLRFLQDTPLEQCARMLRIRPEQVAEAAASAVRMLAEVMVTERAA